MSDVMSFPATVEEFMESYKIVDREEVYTNGAELIPIFRMKQWFEHEAQKVQLKNGTLIIPLNESDFKSVKRIMLDSKPWCRTFYEDVPGEAHWIKKDIPDDGEIYECDNCGVAWAFNDGGPEENEAFFCPKCGFKMERGQAE